MNDMMVEVDRVVETEGGRYRGRCNGVGGLDFWAAGASSDMSKSTV